MIVELLIGAGLEILVNFQDVKIENKDRFRWVSIVQEDPHGMTDSVGAPVTTPHVDPPFGGYGYNKADFSPYYWDDNDCRNCSESFKVKQAWRGNTFKFEDYPSDFRLKGDEEIVFNTCLVDTTKYDEELFCVNWSLTSNRIVKINSHTIVE